MSPGRVRELITLQAIHHGRRDDYVDSLTLAARPLTRPRSEAGPPGLLRVRRDRGWWGP